MKKTFFIFFLCSCGLFIHAQKTFTVKTAEEFATALQSDCEIILESTQIIISDLKPVVNDNYEVIEDSAGNSHIIIKGLSDLRISGIDYYSSSIASSTEYQPVLQFEKCSNITLRNIMLLHGPNKGIMCTGGTLLLSQCENIMIDSCYLFGSGSYGLITAKYPDQKYGAKKITCNECIFSGCSYGIMKIDNASDVLLKHCNFIDNQGGVFIENSKDVSFFKCSFNANHFMPEEPSTNDGLYLSYLVNLEKTDKIIFEGCTITNNTFGFLIYDPSFAEGLLGSTFSNNSFRHGISFNE
jgi:hypothetical protein